MVAALGYFVDIYDLILFGMVRLSSLTDLGVKAADLKAQGVYLFDMQMGGMLVGGILWGIIGDKRGRLSVLFGSITLYSLANIANGFAHTVDSYAICRLVAGIGLAGELGAGITLVSELMGREHRGLGTTLVGALGVSGGVLAGFIGGAFGPGVSWRTAYFIGGGLGLVLLILRLGVVESGLFKAAFTKNVKRGNFFALFTNKQRVVRYLAIIAVGIPIWYVIGVLFTFANDLGAAQGMTPPPSPARALFFCYAGCAVGGMLCGLVSQWLKSRRKVVGIFMIATAIVCVLYLTVGGTNPILFFTLCFFGGAASGYWTVFVAIGAELFGTNLRATATTTIPNFVRGSAVFVTLGFSALSPSLGSIKAAAAMGVVSFAVAIVGFVFLPETYAVDLDYHEE
jgi:MFS family permease